MPRPHPQRLVHEVRPLVGGVCVEPQTSGPLPLRFAFDEFVDLLEDALAAVVGVAVDRLEPPDPAVAPVAPLKGDLERFWQKEREKEGGGGDKSERLFRALSFEGSLSLSRALFALSLFFFYHGAGDDGGRRRRLCFLFLLFFGDEVESSGRLGLLEHRRDAARQGRPVELQCFCFQRHLAVELGDLRGVGGPGGSGAVHAFEWRGGTEGGFERVGGAAEVELG